MQSIADLQHKNYAVKFTSLMLHLFQDGAKYTIIGTGNAPEYFTIDENSGSIRIRQLIKSDPAKLEYYIVSCFF